MRFDFIVNLLDVKNPLSVQRTGPEKSRAAAAALGCLFFVHEVPAAALLPATLVRLGAERFLFAVADGLDAIAGTSSLDERVFHRVRAIGAQGQVIFGRAALVAVSLDRDVDVGMLLQELRSALQ